MRGSLRARFALAAGSLVVLVATAVAVAGYLSLDRSLNREGRSAVAGAAAQLAAVVEPGGEQAGVGDRTGAAGGNFVDLRDPSLVGQFVRPGVWVAVADRAGRELQASPGAPPGLLRPALLASCSRSGSASARRSAPALAVSCRRVGAGRRPAGFIVAAQSLASAQRTLRATRRALIAGVAAGGLASVGLAWLLAARALQPIRRIAGTARLIRQGDVSQRIGYAGRHDELAELAAELDASFAELDGALRRQERFVADASHELKTPLAAARANVQLLRRWAAEEPAARADALAGLDRSTARMARIVADLLQLAYGDARLRYAREPIRLDELVLEVRRGARSLSEGVEVEIERIQPAVVLGDRERLEQLLANLIDNAVRFSPVDSSVRLALHRDGDWVRVAVADEGPGIAPAELPHIFERFYRGRAGEPGSGSGLGLAIARVIARAHGGEIEVDSEPGRGSTFTVRLPDAESSSDRHRDLMADSSRATTLPPQSNARR